MKKIIIATAAAIVSTITAANAFTLEQTTRFQDNYEARFGVDLSRGQANGILNKFQQLRDNNDNARGVIGRSRVIAEFESFGVVDLDNYASIGSQHNRYWGDVRDTVGVNSADVFTSKFLNARVGLNTTSLVERNAAQDRFESNDFVRDIAASQIADYAEVLRLADGVNHARENGLRDGQGRGYYVVYDPSARFGNILHNVSDRANLNEAKALVSERRAIAAAERAAAEAEAAARAELMHVIVAIGIGNASRAADMAAEAGITIQELNDFAVANSNNILGGYIVYGFGDTGTMFEYLRRSR